MRENMGLYRGKRKDNGAWETGGLVITWRGTSREQTFIADKITGYLTPVDPDTVGEFTGCEDKDGVKVFEGDILDAPITVNQETYGDRQYYTVGMIDGQFTLVVRYIPKRNWALPEGYQWGYLCKVLDFDERGYRHSDIVVIGNVHDNPELLEDTP